MILHADIDVQQHCEDTKRSFAQLKSAIREAVANSDLDVCHFVNLIVDLPVLFEAQDTTFIKAACDQLRGSSSVDSVFDRVGFHWDFLHPAIYGHLIKELHLTNLEPKKEAYQKILDRFLEQTPVDKFLKIPRIKGEYVDPPPNFKELVTKHLWNPPPPVSLRDVEDFRIEFVNKCDLRSCAVAIADLNLGSIITTMWVPESVEFKVTSEFIREHSITRIVLDGTIVYTQVSYFVYICTIGYSPT